MADENVILVTFEEETKAYQAASVLKEASAEGRIDLHAVAVVQRMEDGTLIVERTLAWVAKYRRLTIRYERRKEIHEAFLLLGCSLLSFNHL